MFSSLQWGWAGQQGWAAGQGSGAGQGGREEPLGSPPSFSESSQLCRWGWVGKGTKCPRGRCLCLGTQSPEERGTFSPNSQAMGEARRRIWG